MPTLTFNDDNELMSFQWTPGPGCPSDEQVTLDSCYQSDPWINDTFWTELDLEVSCGIVNADSFETNPLNELNVTDIRGNGTMCLGLSEFANANSKLSIECKLDNYPGLETCMRFTGSKAKTFWVYLGIRAVFMVSMNCGFALFDGTALSLAKIHNSEYSAIMLFQLLGSAAGPYLAGALIQDTDDPLGFIIC